MQRAKDKIFFIILAISIMNTLSAPIKENDHNSRKKILNLVLGNNNSNYHLISDINKKEAPRIIKADLKGLHDDVMINASLEDHTKVVRDSRSRNSNDYNLLQSDSQSNVIQSKKLIESDDLEVAGSSYYRDNEHVKGDFSTNNFGELLNSKDESPKIIGVRVTSSVAIARGQINNNNLPSNDNQQSQHDSNNEEKIQGRKIKSGNDVNRFIDDSPTTWRPLHYRLPNHDYYKGAPSTRHTISTLPGSVAGANPDFIQQQRQREILMKKQKIMHPYQRAIIYQNHRPRSYSYSSVLNKFGDDNKHSTTNPWQTSTEAESIATETSAGFVTIINHNGDSSIDHPKNKYDIENSLKLIEEKDQVATSNNDHINVQPPPVPHIYSEPAKVYSEPAKIYSEPAKVYSKQEQIYSEPAKFYSEPAKVYSEPAKVYGEPSKVYSEPAKVYGEPSKVYSQPATVYPHAFPPDYLNPHSAHIHSPIKQPDPDEEYKNIFLANQPNMTRAMLRDEPKRIGEQNYEVDEMINVNTNGRTHGVQDKPDDGKKVGYVVEGRNYRKYRVEERTSDGFIVGEYGVVSHDDGSLRGVRYTADGTTNPRLIHDALMKFLSL